MRPVRSALIATSALAIGLGLACKKPAPAPVQPKPEPAPVVRPAEPAPQPAPTVDDGMDVNRLVCDMTVFDKSVVSIDDVGRPLKAIAG